MSTTSEAPSANTAGSASARFASSGVHGAWMENLRRCTRVGVGPAG